MICQHTLQNRNSIIRDAHLAWAMTQVAGERMRKSLPQTCCGCFQDGLMMLSATLCLSSSVSESAHEPVQVLLCNAGAAARSLGPAHIRLGARPSVGSWLPAEPHAMMIGPDGFTPDPVWHVEDAAPWRTQQ
jgi:hypothetical protein